MSASLGQWVEAVFDHPVRKPQWYWDDDFDAFWDSLQLTDSLTVQYMTRLLSAPEVLRRYSLEQVAQGIWFMVGESSPGGCAHALLKADISLEERLKCVRSIALFFENFVSPAAPGPADTDNNPFHIACYMWWDIFPTYGDPSLSESGVNNTCLDAMARILLLPSELCQLSALHGLNHWHLHHAERVQAVVDGFVRREDLTPRVRDYAALARAGMAQ